VLLSLTVNVLDFSFFLLFFLILFFGLLFSSTVTLYILSSFVCFDTYVCIFSKEFVLLSSVFSLYVLSLICILNLQF
jgi:hypothetical protein